MADALAETNQDREISPTIRDIRDKDRAWSNHLDAVQKWEEASKKDKELSTNTAGTKPEPDQAALRGKEFEDLRAEVYKDFDRRVHQSGFDEKPNFDRLISKIGKTENPTDEIVKSAAFLDLASNYLPNISIPAAVKVIDNCPDSIEMAPKFKGEMVKTILSAKPADIRDNADGMIKLIPLIESSVDASRQGEMAEIAGEVIGTKLFKALSASEIKSLSSQDLKNFLQQNGIQILQTDVQDDRSFDWKGAQNLLADEAGKATVDDARNKMLGASLGIMAQVAEWLPEGRNGNGYNLGVMTEVVNTSEKIKNQPSTPDFVKRKLADIRATMQIKRSSW